MPEFCDFCHNDITDTVNHEVDDYKHINVCRGSFCMEKAKDVVSWDYARDTALFVAKCDICNRIVGISAFYKDVIVCLECVQAQEHRTNWLGKEKVDKE